MFISAIPGIFAECTAMHYRIFKKINLMKGGSRKKEQEKYTAIAKYNYPFLTCCLI